MGYKIYQLTDPLTHAPRYVGKTIQGLSYRLRSHIYDAKTRKRKTALGKWLGDLSCKGLRPGIELLELSASDDWQEVERSWISRLKLAGHELLNVSAGGNGSHDYSCLPPEIVPLLGQVPDADLAIKWGRSRKAVAYHRVSRGIPSPPRRRAKGHPCPWKGQDKVQLPAYIIASLGKVNDIQLAKEAKCSWSTIQKHRRRLGIPPAPPRRGGENPRTKLTSEAAREIRRIYAERTHRCWGKAELARRFGVHQDVVWDVVCRKTWREL